MKYDVIEIETTAKQKDGDWVAPLKGYPIVGEGRSATDAIEDACEEIKKFYERYLGSPGQNVEVAAITLSQKVRIRVELEDTRQTTLFEKEGGSA